MSWGRDGQDPVDQKWRRQGARRKNKQMRMRGPIIGQGPIIGPSHVKRSLSPRGGRERGWLWCPRSLPVSGEVYLFSLQTNMSTSLLKMVTHRCKASHCLVSLRHSSLPPISRKQLQGAFCVIGMKENFIPLQDE